MTGRGDICDWMVTIILFLRISSDGFPNITNKAPGPPACRAAAQAGARDWRDAKQPRHAHISARESVLMIKSLQGKRP
jgi:hypothetical protein